MNLVRIIRAAAVLFAAIFNFTPYVHAGSPSPEKLKGLKTINIQSFLIYDVGLVVRRTPVDIGLTLAMAGVRSDPVTCAFGLSCSDGGGVSDVKVEDFPFAFNTRSEIVAGITERLEKLGYETYDSEKGSQHEFDSDSANLTIILGMAGYYATSQYSRFYPTIKATVILRTDINELLWEDSIELRDDTNTTYGYISLNSLKSDLPHAELGLRKVVC